MDTLDYLVQKFNLDLEQRLPIEIPDFGRDQLAELFHELDFKNIVEVGVCAGEYSEVICKANPQAEVYGVDPFIPYSEYKDYQLNRTINAYHEKAKELERKYPNYQLIEEMSVEAAKDFEDGELDAVYIDANHRFEFVVADIHAWLPKLKKGGIISGHDYSKIKPPTNTHVYEAVNGYTQAHQITWFVLGRNAMIEGEVRDRLRSWMWVV